MQLTKLVCSVLLAAGFLAAQGDLAAGWAMRADSGAGAGNKLMAEGAAIHLVTTGAPTNNATFSNATWTATGNHTFSATLTQNAKATHPDAYGLMIGGSNLDKDDQSYTYFEVRQAGEFYIANRKGATVTPVVAWTKNAAIKPNGSRFVTRPPVARSFGFSLTRRPSPTCRPLTPPPCARAR